MHACVIYKFIWFDLPAYQASPDHPCGDQCALPLIFTPELGTRRWQTFWNRFPARRPVSSSLPTALVGSLLAESESQFHVPTSQMLWLLFVVFCLLVGCCFSLFPVIGLDGFLPQISRILFVFMNCATALCVCVHLSFLSHFCHLSIHAALGNHISRVLAIHCVAFWLRVRASSGI